MLKGDLSGNCNRPVMVVVGTVVVDADDDSSAAEADTDSKTRTNRPLVRSEECLAKKHGIIMTSGRGFLLLMLVQVPY